jgi:hypothetical protein
MNRSAREFSNEAPATSRSQQVCTGLVPVWGVGIGFVDGLTAATPVPHAVIYVVPRRGGRSGRAAGVRRVDQR